uniref:Acyltransferase 3 domain-containing protein n=1 Tax=Panagrolaimus sp. PS1159 TaxID=55785 RepID=A0AC35FB84_9BILA
MTPENVIISTSFPSMLNNNKTRIQQTFSPKPFCYSPTQTIKSIAAFVNDSANAAVGTVSTATTGIWSIIGTWLALIITGTFYDTKYSAAFSIKQNYKELTQHRLSKFTCIDYFRIIAILWVMINHTGSEGRIDILERQPSAKAFKDAVHSHPFFGPLFGNSGLGVEIFLVLSGFLAARSWYRSSQSKTSSFFGHYIGFIIKRALRLFPSVAVFVWLAQSSLSAQYMPRFYDSMVSTCGIKGIASHLTFTSNLQSTPTCLGYLWYLGLDFQLYIISPIFMAVLLYNSALGIALIGAVVSASSIYRAYFCWTHDICNKSDVDIPFISFPGQTEAELQSIYYGLWDIYSRPQTKCGPFLIGLLAAIFCIFGILPEYWYPDAGNTVYNTFYTATFRSIFALCTSWLLFYGIYWFKASSIVFFNVLATITFQAYLLHMPVVYLFNNCQMLQDAMGPWEVLYVLPGVAIISYIGAFILYLTIEAPMAKIASYFYENMRAHLIPETKTSKID